MRGLVKVACGVAMACVFGLGVQAQTTALLPVTPQKLVLAQQVFDASGAKRNYDLVVKTFLDRMSAGMNQGLGGADDKAFLNTLMQDEMTKIGAKVLDNSAQIYAQTFTDQELRDLLTFYRSPTGRSFVAKTPEVLNRTNAVIAPLIPPMQRDILDRVFAYACAKQKCTPEQQKQIEAAKEKALSGVSVAPPVTPK